VNAPSFADALRTWTRVALLSFGGPAGQIAVMHRILVEEKRWIEERRFLHALNFCMLLPGPEAQQLATYLGWLLHGWRGGLAAGALFVLPGFVAILLLSLLYAGYQDTLAVTALFFGLKPAVTAVVIDALIRIGRRALRGAGLRLLALGAFAAMFFLHAPFSLVLLGAALLGLIADRVRRSRQSPGDAVAGEAAREPIPDASTAGPPPPWTRTAAIAVGGVLLWWLPVACLWIALGRSHVLVTCGLFFSQVAVMSFGGAYAVLSYVAQQAVHHYGWLTPGEMIDGLGMAETTPGPLIMVVQFVGYMAAFRNPGGLDPTWAGVIGSILVTWVTFVPCFLWIFLGAPYVETLRRNRALESMLTAITAAVVGVILNLTVWFALHVLFAEVSEARWGPFRVLVPDPSTAQPAAMLIAAGALVALLGLRWGIMRTLLAAVAVGAAWVVARS